MGASRSEKVTFPGGGDVLAARLDTPAGKPRAYALFAHCFTCNKDNDLLLAGLGACTSMTMRMYAGRKGLKLERVAVTLKHDKAHAEDCATCEAQTGKIDRIERQIEITGELTAEERAKLMEIADKYPVHWTLHSEVWEESRLKE
jgi:uncharacterized OsmC-like protein